MKFLVIYIILLLLFQLPVEINCQMITFKPKQRRHHTATLINNKLYILGGSNVLDDGSNDGNINVDNSTIGKDFFYLDFSGPFNTKNLAWQNLSNINIVPSHNGATSVKGGENNNTLFLYGGNSSADANAELVYAYDPQNNKWSIPEIVGNKVRLA